MSSATLPSADGIRRAPKVLLHDHLDGGLRPQTVIDLAREVDYQHLPSTDAGELGTWFSDAADCAFLSFHGGYVGLERMRVDAVLEDAPAAEPDDHEALVRIA